MNPSSWLVLLLALTGLSRAAEQNSTWLLCFRDTMDVERVLETCVDSIQLEPALPPASQPPPNLESIMRAEGLDQDILLWLKVLDAEGLSPLWMEREPKRAIDLLPDDSRYGDLWALPHIQAPAAWDLHTASGEIVIAVVDTGAELDHPDLAGSLWNNLAEMNGQAGVDDDANGWVDDFHGYDFQDEDPDPSSMDAPGGACHGTHTGGTAACVTDNGVGVSCAAWQTRHMVVRAGSGSYIRRGAEGIWYAARSGADIISCSFGGDSYSNYEREVIRAAQELGCLVVASAGNNGNQHLHYPAAYEGVLGIVNSNQQDERASGSSYGWWVDLCAPGQQILSTVNGQGYSYKSGTSMATPLVASLAALAWSHFPAENNWQIQARLTGTCDNIDAQNPGESGLLGSGRVNALRLLSEQPLALRLSDWSLQESDGNGYADPGETVSIRLMLEGVLGDLDQLQIQADLPEGGGSFSDASVWAGTLHAGQTLDLSADPLTLTIGQDVEAGEVLRIRLLATAAGAFTQTMNLQLQIAPLYTSHSNGQLDLSLDASTRLGFFDFENAQQQGLGLTWPDDSPSHAYIGSFVLATPDQICTHSAHYLTGVGPDFLPAAGGEIRIREEGDVQISNAECEALERPGLLLRQEAISKVGEDWLLLEWEVLNNSDANYVGLQPGLWLDLDILNSWDNDEVNWSSAQDAGWMTDSGGSFVGLRLLDQPASTFRACNWGEWTGGGLEDDELHAFMNNAFDQVQSDAPGDWQLCISAAGADLGPGEARRFTIALAGANSEAALFSALEQASEFWSSPVEEPVHRPVEWSIEIAPNPFNPSTQFRIWRPEAGEMGWKLWDMSGRLVLEDRLAWAAAGEVRGQIDLSGHASGRYIIEWKQGAVSHNRPLLLLK